MIPKIKRITNTHNTSKRNGPIEYIAIHYTSGTTSAAGKAKDNAIYYAVTNEKASADFFIDDETIVQYNPSPLTRYCWAVGGKVADTSQGGGKFFGIAKNSNSISIELCSTNSTGAATYPNDPSYSFTSKVISNAVTLTKYLMKEYNIPADHVIRHFDVTGKLCPGIIGWNEPSGDVTVWNTFK